MSRPVAAAGLFEYPDRERVQCREPCQPHHIAQDLLSPAAYVILRRKDAGMKTLVADLRVKIFADGADQKSYARDVPQSSDQGFYYQSNADC